MEQTELSPSELTDRINRLQAQLAQLQDTADMHGLVLSWLLARCPGDDALRFLSGQANELASSPGFLNSVAVLDELREDLERWHAQRASEPSARRS